MGKETAGLVASSVTENLVKSIIVNHCLWLTAHCLRHSIFAEIYLILEGGRENKITQIFFKHSADISDPFVHFWIPTNASSVCHLQNGQQKL